jgi:hypothetical protein
MPKKKSKSAKAGGASSDAVGYGKPPKHTRFKPGESGNPSGRPKGTKNLKTIARREFEQKIEVREGQRVREITKKEAFVKGTINRALQKGGKDSDTALRLLAEIEGDAEAASAPLIPLSQDEDEVLAAYEARLRRKIVEELAAAAAATTHADEGGNGS